MSPHKTSLIPPLFVIETKAGKGAAMYIAVPIWPSSMVFRVDHVLSAIYIVWFYVELGKIDTAINMIHPKYHRTRQYRYRYIHDPLEIP
jgi:hypothetical protein